MYVYVYRFVFIPLHVYIYIYLCIYIYMCIRMYEYGCLVNLPYVSDQLEETTYRDSCTKTVEKSPKGHYPGLLLKNSFELS